MVGHIVLMPLILIAIVGAHVLLVCMRGSHPLPEKRVKGRAARKAAEANAATVIVRALTFTLAGLLSSPDIPAVTVQAWAALSSPGGPARTRSGG